MNKYIEFNRPRIALKAEGIVLHETATPEATAQNIYNYFNKVLPKGSSASCHDVVDNKGVIHVIPYNERSWHAGAIANRSYIGIEMCNTKDPVKFADIYKNTINLLAHIFIEFNWGFANKANLLSHYDVTMKWHETDHVDPIGYLKQYGLNMDNVRNDVNKKIYELRGVEKQMQADKAKDKLKEFLSPETIEYLAAYKYANDLFIKLAERLK